MKNINKYLLIVWLSLIFSTSCVDDVLIGNDFLEKAPGGDLTIEQIFANAEYTRQYLTSIYALQYYGLPYKANNDFPFTMSAYTGKFDVLSDCWQDHSPNGIMWKNYYSGKHSAGYGQNQDKFDFKRNNVWEAVYSANVFIKNIVKTPNMDAAEKDKLIAEAKCLIAAKYFDLFRHYGGLPIMTEIFTGTESSYELPRQTVEQTVDFMVKLLDEASGVLPWALDNPSADAGRWTKAGAMALKCEILLFAASPLFNSATPYSEHQCEAITENHVWYGGYKPELWTKCKDAYSEFFTELNNSGNYQLVQATGTKVSDYRVAFRKAYFMTDSPEVIHSVRVTGKDEFRNSNYQWHSYQGSYVERINYCPTQEYVEMFSWADGTPFDWATTEAAGLLNNMFSTGTIDGGDLTLTRDARLYETVVVNGMLKSLNTNTGQMSGDVYELWVGGAEAGVVLQNRYATGYANHKYYLGDDAKGLYAHWSYLRLSELYLGYAEAKLHTGDLQGAIDQVDIVRARVGMQGLVQSNPSLNLTTNKDALLKEILRERVCELGLEDTRLFDMIRYKLKDEFEKTLHRIHIYRLDANGDPIRTACPWRGGDKGTVSQPTVFKYEKLPMGVNRYWWTSGFDSKWYLSPIPVTEVNKNYGLTQNPGW